jgi:hypothetical protein
VKEREGGRERGRKGERARNAEYEPYHFVPNNKPCTVLQKYRALSRLLSTNI